MHNYASLQETHDIDEEGGVIYHVAESTTSRWNHIDNLDSFFTQMYKYHQKRGFLCIVLGAVLEHALYLINLLLITYVVYGINYDLLTANNAIDKRIGIFDIILPFGECMANIHWVSWVIIFFVLVTFVFSFLRQSYSIIHFYDIKQFYNTALHIQDSDLENLTWHEVQNRVKDVQLEQQMCIHKRELTNLDIYHRILRQENYLVAMVNKKLIPTVTNLPFLGEFVFFPNYLKLTYQFLIFWSPWGLFEKPWQLRTDIRTTPREVQAEKLRTQIFWLIIVNILFGPFIVVWFFFYYVFTFYETLRRDPGKMGVRHWSLYGSLYLRHFNELDHELNARLTRAYEPATKYVSCTSSPIGMIIAKFVTFVCSGPLAILFFLALLYNDVIVRVEFIFTLATVCSALIRISGSFIPDGTTIAAPEPLLKEVVKHIHYMPENWRGQAHTSRIRNAFDQFFQYHFIDMAASILSPIIVAYVLWTHTYPKSQEIIDFYKNFTISVVGVGDVCSFAQLDLRKHGNPDWQSSVTTDAAPPRQVTESDEYLQAEDGKVELSLIHFTANNPSWEPPPEAKHFVEELPKPEQVHFDIHGDYMTSLFTSSISPEALERVKEDAPGSMNYSALFVHNRHEQIKTDRNVKSAEETTPLLASVSTRR